jgi:cytochrome c oxidase cbb3-type subunit 3
MSSIPSLLIMILAAAAMAPGQQPGPAGTPANQRRSDLEAAPQIFATRCAGCHGLDGRGGERAPDIATQAKTRQLSDPQIFAVLQRGVPQTSMPSFGYLGDDALRSLVAHVRTLQGDRATSILPGDASRGRKIFYEKGACSRCHMIHGDGGFFASDLTHYALGRSPEVIHDAIVFPNRDLAPRQRTVVATLASGQSLQGIALNEDNFAIQMLTPDGTLHLLPKAALASLAYRNESPMPADYATRLSASEINDLVNFLSSLTEKETKVIHKHEDQDAE